MMILWNHKIYYCVFQQVLHALIFVSLMLFFLSLLLVVLPLGCFFLDCNKSFVLAVSRLLFFRMFFFDLSIGDDSFCQIILLSLDGLNLGRLLLVVCEALERFGIKS